MAAMQKSPWIWMDGDFVPWDEAKVHVLSHALHYGFGVFEGIRAYQRADGRSAVFPWPFVSFRRDAAQSDTSSTFT